MSEIPFLPWDGEHSSSSPFPPGVVAATVLEVRFRNGFAYKGVAQSFGWAHSEIHPEVHITEYRVLQ